MAQRWRFYDDVDKRVIIAVEDHGGLLTVQRTGGKPTRLTDIPSRLLRQFLDHPGKAFSEEELKQLIWPQNSYGKKIHPHLRVLRKALRGLNGRFLKKSAGYYQLLNGPDDLLDEPGHKDSSSDLLRLTTLDDLSRWDPTGRNRIHRFLDPLHAKIPFIGRRTEAARLINWMKGEQRVSLQILVGPGGRGKTRLAVNLLEELERSFPHQWHAGFLDGDDNCGNTLKYDRFWRWQGRDTLLIIDDASRWANALATNVIPAVLRTPEHRLRFLLIDRGVEDSYEWYNALVNAAKTETHLFPPPLRLEPLDHVGLDLSERRALLEAALSVLHEFDGQPKLIIDDVAVERLRSAILSDPLVVLMAAIVAHERRDLSSLAYGRIDLADVLVKHELNRLTLLSQTQFPLRHMAAYVTLARGLTVHMLNACCHEEREHLSPNDPAWSVTQLRRIIAEQALPSTVAGAAASGVVPDFVGEIFVETIFREEDQDAVETAFRAWQRRPDDVSWTLVRMIHDFAPELTNQSGHSPRAQLLIGWVSKLFERLIQQSEDLGEANIKGAMDRSETIVGLGQQLARETPRYFGPNLAHSYKKWADILTVAGDHRSAVLKYVEAVKRIKPFALESETFWNTAVGLATACFNASNTAGYLLDYSVIAPFLPVHSETDVGNLMEVVRQTPFYMLGTVSKHLVEVASAFPELSRDFADAARSRHRNVFEDSGQFPSEAARFDELLARAWDHAGYPDEALTALQRAVGYFRLFAETNRQAGLADLARVLCLQADFQVQLLHRAEANASLLESISLYRDSKVRTEGEGPALQHSFALALYKRAILHMRADKPAALLLLNEAQRLMFELASTDPQPYMQDWGIIRRDQIFLAWVDWKYDEAIEMSNQKWSTVDDWESSLPRGVSPKAESESVEHYRRLEFLSEDPDGYAWLNICASRTTAENIFAIHGPASGIGSISAVEQLCERRLAQDQGRFLARMTEALSRKCQWLVFDGAVDVAIATIERTLGFCSELLGSGSRQFEVVREALLLHQRLILLRKSADPKTIDWSLLDGTIRECRTLTKADQGRFTLCLVQALELKSVLLSAADVQSEALLVVTETVDLWKMLCSRERGFLGCLARSLEEKTALESACGFTDRALMSNFEAIRHYSDFAAADYKRYMPQLTKLMGLQVVLLGSDETPPQALRELEEQIERFDRLQDRNLFDHQIEQFERMRDKLVSSDPKFWIGMRTERDEVAAHFRYLAIDARLSRALYLVSAIVDEKTLQASFESYADVALRYEGFISHAKDVTDVSSRLALVYGIWGLSLLANDGSLRGQPGEAAGKLSQSLRYALGGLSSGTAPSIIQFRGAYLEACRGAVLEPDPQLLLDVGAFVDKQRPI